MKVKVKSNKVWFPDSEFVYYGFTRFENGKRTAYSLMDNIKGK